MPEFYTATIAAGRARHAQNAPKSFNAQRLDACRITPTVWTADRRVERQRVALIKGEKARMPIKKSHGVRALAAALLVAAALPSAASAATFSQGACATPTMSQPFIGLDGDDNRYFLAPGGDFEQGGVWSTSGEAEYTPTDRPGADAWGGSTALRIEAGSTTSPTFCVDDTYPHLRLAAKAAQLTAVLTIEAIPEGGAPVVLDTLTGAEFGSWSYSRFVPLAPAVGLSLNQATPLKLRVRAIGDWSIDAVSIDPRKAA
jgi:hypothetical protein